MAAKNDKSFIRNVAKERTYQNQDKKYEDAYFKWRTDEKNQYSFNYVQDTREHSYMAGSGFIKHNADTAEQATLHNCLRLLGVVMLVMLLYDVLIYLLMVYLNDGVPCNVVFLYEKEKLGSAPLKNCLICSGLQILKFVTAITIYHVRTRLPFNVAMPRGNVNATPSFKMNAVIIMLMIVVIGRLCSVVLSNILTYAKIDSVYIYMYNTPDKLASVISLVFNCIVLPVMIEVFFRGLVLQSFRQFGDSFAVVVAAVACGLSFYDVTYMGFAILCSAVIGVFTLRSGSIVTAILMHSVSTMVNYILTYIGLLNADLGKILSIAVCILICASALVVYSRLISRKDWSFNMERGDSELPFTKKVELMMSSNTVAMWFVCAVVMTIVSMRFLR